jgi:xanthine dehydrogenase accessory factor
VNILIRGANDVASAVAHRLFTSGYAVAIHESPQPTTARRKMSFADAAFDGESVLENVAAKLVDIPNLRGFLSARRALPFCIEDFSALLAALRPEVLIDARMRKHQQPEAQRGLAPLTIGLGPNFSAGKNVDLAIETGWGESLGQVVSRGATNPLAGEPREIKGHARDRYVYAPVAGIFHTALQIGERVKKDGEVARVDSFALLAPISGTLRGLTRDGVYIAQKTKVIEVDPRETGAQFSGIGERPARIAEGVKQAVELWLAGKPFG